MPHHVAALAYVSRIGSLDSGVAWHHMAECERNGSNDGGEKRRRSIMASMAWRSGGIGGARHQRNGGRHNRQRGAGKQRQ
jgi:hypothetical protein